MWDYLGMGVGIYRDGESLSLALFLAILSVVEKPDCGKFAWGWGREDRMLGFDFWCFGEYVFIISRSGALAGATHT